MTSEDLFAGVYARGPVARGVCGRAWLQAMLDVEAALARACAREQVIPDLAAETIAASCSAERFDINAIAREAARHASPVVPLVRALREQVGDQLARYVHLGATSQDILDTAAMLVSSRALELILTDAHGGIRAAARLAGEHRTTAMSGRTLLQQALPTTFGLRAAAWLTGIDEARARLKGIRERELAVQMGGPVGARAPAVATLVAEQLGLAEPVMPWHTIRVRAAALASALAVLAGVFGKVGRDVTLLAQDEVGEVREGGDPGGGGSTAMAHKHNPVAAVSVIACARRTPALASTMLSSMEQEHERAAGAWQAEWGTLTELLALTGSAASWTRDLLEHLEVDDERMRENLRRLAASGVPEAMAPERHLDAASELIDRALATAGA